MLNMRGGNCPYKSLTCQEGYCNECEIYLVHKQSYYNAGFERGKLEQHRADVEWIKVHSVRFELKGAIGMFIAASEKDWQDFIKGETLQ